MNEPLRAEPTRADVQALAQAAGLPLKVEDFPAVVEAMREYQEHLRVLSSVELPLDAPPGLALDPTRWTAPTAPEAPGQRTDR